MDLINDLLNQVGNLSTGALVVAGVLAAGYVIKAIPQMPNGLIPLVTLGVAVTLQILMGDRSTVDYTVRHPEVRLAMVGVVYWAIGWLIHNQGLSRLEKFLPAPLRGLLGAEVKDEPQNTKETQMKNMLMLALLGACLALTTPCHASDEWSWTAPNPPLPFTEHYFTGWDGTDMYATNPPAPDEPRPDTETVRRTLTPPLASLMAMLPAPEAAGGAAPKKQTASTWVNSVSVSPYATVAFADFDGDQTGGVGLALGAGISRNVSLVAFGESDDEAEGSFIDRAGLGLRVTGKVTKALSVFGQMSGGYSFDDTSGLRRDEWFIRPQFGANLDFWRKKSAHIGLTASWALDVDLDGNTVQRLFGGLVAGTSF